jgi:ligand-binding sensor domain-containing protein
VKVWPTRTLASALPGFAKAHAAIPPKIQLERLSTSNGISSALSILQDQQGFLWFGGWEGLDRYDGVAVRHFRHDPEDRDSLGAGIIVSLLEDRSGMLWISLGPGGLDLFDPRAQRFLHYRHDSEKALGRHLGRRSQPL